MRQPGADDDRQRAEDADPQQHRELADRADVAVEQEHREDADDCRGCAAVRAEARHEHGEVVREADAARRHRQRRGEEDLEEKEEGDQSPEAAVGVAEKRVRAARRRQLRGELGGDEAVANGEQAADDPGEHRAAAAHFFEDERDRDEGADPDHVDHVQRDAAPQPNFAFELRHARSLVLSPAS